MKGEKQNLNTSESNRQPLVTQVSYDIAIYNVNDFNDCMICSKDIYPDSIPLTVGCRENHKDTFLDLDITIDGNKFITKVLSIGI